MINKADIQDALLREIEIVRHLASKVTAANAGYRPTEGQRTMLELLQYLSFCGAGGAASMVDGNWDRYKKWSEGSSALTLEGVDAALAQHGQWIENVMGEISDDDFSNKKATTPVGEEMPLGRALLEVPCKWMVAYRMQLFLYLKSSGLSDIGTYNCWAGKDAPVEV